MSRYSTLLATGVLFAALLVGSPSAFATDVVEPSLLEGNEWRLIGPYRGGRVTTVTGVRDNDQLYYMGAPG